MRAIVSKAFELTGGKNIFFQDKKLYVTFKEGNEDLQFAISWTNCKNLVERNETAEESFIGPEDEEVLKQLREVLGIKL